MHLEVLQLNKRGREFQLKRRECNCRQLDTLYSFDMERMMFEDQEEEGGAKITEREQMGGPD